MIDRRTFFLTAMSLAAARPDALLASGLPHVLVHKDPSCGCCQAWVEHLKAAGFSTTVRENAAMDAVKDRLSVPAELQSCHTAEVGGYVIEGHVPAAEIKRLLAEKPAAKGLAVPGMPAGSPGMETPGAPDVYSVVLFGALPATAYARYRGTSRI